jgi:beta-lactamase class D
MNQPMNKILFFAIALITLASCREARIKDHPEWEKQFKAQGITNACFMLRDHAHESIHFYNKERCLERFSPASTFKIFNSLVALETGIAQDETLTIPWDSVVRRPEWNKNMNMREAFKVSNVAYYQELARRIGAQNLQHYLDTVKYGNQKIGAQVDSFWLNNSLQISADEQVGFLKKLYFEELPFTLRTQTIVRSMMLREDTAGSKLFYKTGWGQTQKGDQLLWIVGFMEHQVEVKENKNSMNKSDVRNYPYIFALNFEVPKGDTSKDWGAVRTEILHQLLSDYGAYTSQ